MSNRVAICIPSGDMVHADFAMALSAVAYMAGPHEGRNAIPIAIINVKGSLIVNNRNELVRQARELKVDYMFFVDSDIILPSGSLHQLLAANKDIIGATYVQRGEPHRLLGKAIDGTMLDEAMNGKPIDVSTPMEVGALPGGCLLIKMSVFDKLTKPYFRTIAHEATADTPEWIEGEDYYFSRIVRAAGYQIWLDWRITLALGHIGQKVNNLSVVQKEEEQQNALIH